MTIPFRINTYDVLTYSYTVFNADSEYAIIFEIGSAVTKLPIFQLKEKNLSKKLSFQTLVIIYFSNS